ncbi:hypothetical protein ACJX0J_030906 [Zea mays]
MTHHCLLVNPSTTALILIHIGGMHKPRSSFSSVSGIIIFLIIRALEVIIREMVKQQQIFKNEGSTLFHFVESTEASQAYETLGKYIVTLMLSPAVLHIHCFVWQYTRSTACRLCCCTWAGIYLNYKELELFFGTDNFVHQEIPCEVLILNKKNHGASKQSFILAFLTPSSQNKIHFTFLFPAIP